MLLLLATVLALLAARTLAARHMERRTLSRLRPGDDGIIPGAAPIELRAPGSSAGVLLLHGFGDTPQTLSALARALHEAGYDVRLPLLPGHGRTLRAFASSRGEEWLAAARGELRAMQASHDQVAIVGLSMGGALAAVLAGEIPGGGEGTGGVEALVLIAPYLALPQSLRRLVRWHPVIDACVPYLAGGSDRSIRDPSERASNLAYRATTARLVHELSQVADRARHSLPAIRVPTLIVQSHGDNRVPAAVAESALASLGSADKSLVWVDDGAHVITVDHGRERVFEVVQGWLRQWMPAGRKTGVKSEEGESKL